MSFSMGVVWHFTPPFITTPIKWQALILPSHCKKVFLLLIWDMFRYYTDLYLLNKQKRTYFTMCGHIVKLLLSYNVHTKHHKGKGFPLSFVCVLNIWLLMDFGWWVLALTGYKSAEGKLCYLRSQKRNRKSEVISLNTWKLVRGRKKNVLPIALFFLFRLTAQCLMGFRFLLTCVLLHIQKTTCSCELIKERRRADSSTSRKRDDIQACQTWAEQQWGNMLCVAISPEMVMGSRGGRRGVEEGEKGVSSNEAEWKTFQLVSMDNQ